MCKCDNNDHNPEFHLNQLNIANSALSIKCSGLDMENQIKNDLNLPEGKSIAELIYEQEENRPTPQN